jgi:DNA-directed RNA polymerase II subunit RPB2
MANN